MYVKGSVISGLMFSGMRNGGDMVTDYVDSDFAGCANKRKFQNNYVFTFWDSNQLEIWLTDSCSIINHKS